MREQLVFRVRIIAAAILFLVLLLVVRAYYLQIERSDYYEEKGQRQYVYTKADLFSRGSLFFTTKDGEQLSAASLQSGFLLAANPELIPDKDAVCASLSDLFPQLTEKCISLLTAPNRTYVELLSETTTEEAEAVKALSLPGITLYRNQWRYYPGNQVAARTIGFVGYTDKDPDRLRGKYGLERQYDSVLYNQQEVMSVNFFAELFAGLGIEEGDSTDTPVRSGSVVTTLEPAVSRMLDAILEDAQATYGSTLTGGIVMNPQTGEIYAMNAIPTFNLNDRNVSDVDAFTNPLVESVYEFGLTIKALTMAAGLDSGVVRPASTYYDAGSLELDTFTIRNFDGKGRGTVSMQEVLNQSLNTGVAHIVTLMGKERFRDYFMRYKLGSESGIDLPNEAFGLVDNLNSPRDVEYATASFGQGIAMTPIATIRALATLGNGGVLVTPHIASHILYDDGTKKDIRYPDGAQVLKPETSEEISRMLTVVVDDALQGGKWSLPHHTVAAKTGTAQIPDPIGGGYYEDRFLHSFFGYFPVYDPQFIIFLYTVEPKGVRYASETLTKPFMDMTRFLLNYYSVPPDR